MAESRLLKTEPPQEHLRNVLQLLHGLTTYEMSSADVLRHKETLTAIRERVEFAVRQLEGRA